VRVFKTILFLPVLMMLSGFVFAQTPAVADAAARDAVRRLEAALSGGSAAGSTASTSATSGAASGRNTSAAQSAVPQTPAPPAQVTRGGTQPRWIDDLYSAYNRDHFIAAVGSGPNRNQAEARALGALAAIFGQSIRSEFTMATNYTEAVSRGVVSVSENTSVRDRIATAAAMDNLVGAEIGNVWDNGRGTIYAVAFMDKARTVAIYTDMIIINNHNIDILTAMSATERNSLDGFARFRLASQIAGINFNYAAVINQAGGSTASLNLRTAESFSIESTNILRNITVTVNVVNDRASRVQDAFARVLSAEGLRTRGNNPRYTLEVRLSVNEVPFPGSPHVFCRIEGSANLVDNTTGASLFPFSFNDRAGHTNYTNAEAAAFTNIERIIAERYPALLREYLASLIPVR